MASISVSGERQGFHDRLPAIDAERDQQVGGGVDEEILRQTGWQWEQRLEVNLNETLRRGQRIRYTD